MPASIPTTPYVPLKGAYLLWTPTDANGNVAGPAQTLKFDCVEDEDWELDTTVTEHPVEQGPNVSDNVRISLARVTLTVFVTNEPIGQSNWETAAQVSSTFTLPAPGQSPKSNQALVAKNWENMIPERSVTAGVAAGIGGALGGTTGGIIGNAAGAVVGGLLFAPHEVDTSFNPGAGLDPTPGGTATAQTYQFQTGGDYVAKTWAQLKYLKGDVNLGSLPQLLTVIGTKDSADNMVIETLNPKRNAETGTGARFTIGLKQIRTVSTVTVTAPAPTKPTNKSSVSKGTQNPTDAPPKVSQSWLKTATGILYSTLGGQKVGPGIAGVPQ